MSSPSVCSQELTDSCSRVNNIGFFFLVFIPIIIPVMVCILAVYKDLFADFVNADGRVSISMSDRNLNFRRRSMQAANNQTEMTPTTGTNTVEGPFKVRITTNDGITRELGVDGGAPPREGSLMSLNKSSGVQFSRDERGRFVVSDSPGLYLSSFGGDPSEGALLCLTDLTHAGFITQRNGILYVRGTYNPSNPEPNDFMITYQGARAVDESVFAIVGRSANHSNRFEIVSQTHFSMAQRADSL